MSSLVQATSPSPQTESMAAPHITSLIEKDQSGIYQRILNEAIPKLGFNVVQSYSPYKRALISSPLDQNFLTHPSQLEGLNVGTQYMDTKTAISMRLATTYTG